MKAKRTRDYRKEYDDYYGKKNSPHLWTRLQKKHRQHKVNRNRARAFVQRKIQKRNGGSRSAISTKMRNYDVDHADGNPMNNDPSNLVVLHKSKNRAKNGHKNGK